LDRRRPAQRHEEGAPRGATLLLVVAGFILAAITQQVCAQERHDYYGARLDKRTSNLLYQVEKHHLAQGTSELRSRQYQYAYGDLSFILRYFPNHPQALMLMTELCIKWKQPARCDAEARLQEAIDINPEAADTYTIQGIHLQNTGRLDQAIESYKKALTLNPSSRNAHYNLGLAYVSKKDFVQANEHAQQAYALGMTPPGLRNMLTKAGAWKPLPPDAPAPPPATAAPPAETPSESSSAAK
jgi:tetratricopeptide (TPR) repeat protein